MEAIFKLLGLPKSVKKYSERLQEIENLNNHTAEEIDDLEETIIATVNGEGKWFLCERVQGGKRKGDKSTDE